MGRRSINTTKSGKYMNPTDQARKEARKKELKKNKKQRQMVRAAVLKGKDPAQLIEEMEKIDEMEFNVFQPSPLNEKVLREKRKKLKDTLDRVLRLYQQDDTDLWTELKRKEVDYEKRRNKRVQYYESVRHAQTVQIDEIPLPSSSADAPVAAPALPRIQMPIPPPSILMPIAPPPGILKKLAPEPVEEEKHEKEPPGCPAGPPPNLKKMRELDSDYEDEMAAPKKKSKLRFSDEMDKKASEVDDEKLKPNSVQQKMLALSGQNIDDFMKEMENVQKKNQAERLAEEGKDKAASDGDSAKESDSDDNDDSDEDSDDRQSGLNRIPVPSVAAAIIPNPAPPIGLPPMPSSVPPVNMQQPPLPIGMPPGMMFRPPPPLRPGMPGIRMPPGPPPGHRPRMAIRMPPPPPRHLHHHQKGHHGPGGGLNVVSAGPQLTSKDPKSATITAKPQIRNLSADVTRFVPSTLRTKRDDVKKPKPKPFVQDTKQADQTKGPTKDDAYAQFMNEMQGLL